jgi:hypothetical protein
MLSRSLTSDPRTKFFYQCGDGLPTMGKLPKPDFAGTTKKARGKQKPNPLGQCSGNCSGMIDCLDLD